MIFYLRIRFTAAHGMEGGGDGEEETKRQAVDHRGDGLRGVHGARQQLPRPQRRGRNAQRVRAYVGHVFNLQGTICRSNNNN